MPNLRHNPALTPRARELRKNMTPQERKLWYCFLRTYPVRFLRQKVIDFYIADFYCRAAQLVIELDGSRHFTRKGLENDSARTDWLNSRGLRVLRFTNSEIDCRFLEVCAAIDHIVRQGFR